MPQKMKQSMADEVRAQLASSPDLLVVGLLSMDAAKNHQLRSELRRHGARLRVIHNRTSRFALDDARKEIGRLFVGQTALALAAAPGTEFIPVAKALVDVARKKTIEVRGGFVEGEMLDKAGVEALALCPDKPTLRGMVLGAIQGSARGLALALSGSAAGLARCLQARIDQSEETDS